ncbi:DUF3014 domain-containing protein [Methylomonas sp. MgM2]
MGRYDQFEPKKPSGALIGLILLVLAAGFAWYYFSKPVPSETAPERRELALPSLPSEMPATQALSEQTVENPSDPNSTDPNVQAVPEQAVELPELAKSDSTFREAVLAISPGLAPWLKTKQIIRRYVTIANDFSQGLWLEKHMRFLKHAQPFSVDKTDQGVFIAKESYHRYDALASAIDAIDAKKAMAVYQRYKPLLQEVYDGFGYPPERPLEDIFLKSASQILAAPVIEQPIAVVRPSVYYKFANDKLEKLSPVSKQMLRMGPNNTRVIQDKVRQLVQELVSLKD